MSSVAKLMQVGFHPFEALHLGETGESSLTALGASSQANAYEIEDTVNVFTTVTGTNNSAKLPLIAEANRTFYVVSNFDADDNLLVFPNTDESINELADNLSVIVQPKGSNIFIVLDDNTWLTFPIGGSLAHLLGGERHDNLVIPAYTEISQAHNLGITPTSVIFVERKDGHVEDGDTANDATDFYLKNIGGFVATVSVIVAP